MTRRGRVRAEVEVVQLDQAPRLTRSADDLLVAVLAGEVRVAHDGQVSELRIGDVVASNDRRSLTIDGTGIAAVIGLVHR
jgi:hypothetical protein